MTARIIIAIIGLIISHASTRAATLSDALAHIQKKWAIINYQTPDKAQQEADITTLLDQATQVVQAYPGKAEPLLWQATILCTKAGIESNEGSLVEVEKARDLFLQAKKINPKALSGMAFSSLGWIYHKVPSWPIAFGDDNVARSYLEKAVSMYPNSLDANFFYASFLNDTGDTAKALSVLERASKIPLHPNPSLAETERQQDIINLLQKIDRIP